MGVSETVGLAARIFGVEVDEAHSYAFEMDIPDATYYCAPVMGSPALIVGDDQRFLYAGSWENPNDHMDRYLSGERTPLSQLEGR